MSNNEFKVPELPSKSNPSSPAKELNNSKKPKGAQGLYF